MTWKKRPPFQVLIVFVIQHLKLTQFCEGTKIEFDNAVQLLKVDFSLLLIADGPAKRTLPPGLRAIMFELLNSY